MLVSFLHPNPKPKNFLGETSALSMLLSFIQRNKNEVSNRILRKEIKNILRGLSFFLLKFIILTK